MIYCPLQAKAHSALSEHTGLFLLNCDLNLFYDFFLWVDNIIKHLWHLAVFHLSNFIQLTCLGLKAFLKTTAVATWLSWE